MGKTPAPIIHYSTFDVKPVSELIASNRIKRGLHWRLTTWPRYRYDQLMNLGWKRLIPLGMAVILLNAVVGMLKGR